ncbi:alpha/beta hydrolase [Streptomyces sp. RB6PN25]|uniref:Alpha/beta hydrolase n=1 Tax=Streptomyces humicola TaxID=2953240 RepID=A0ABT1PTQ0_9ACTN|nr:alpha/beta hydrolase [Streptomyces humicola]MCQ4081049.1 alpha/beta hydrolase [Streptomyces humicola]
MTTGIEQWWSGGDLVPLTVAGVSREVFVRRIGSGPVMTLLHGFPSSSHDWAQVVPDLAAHHTLLMPDFLGFGASEKPADHDYSIHEQADLVVALWQHEAVASTHLVAHDYGTTVAQELLARSADGSLKSRITSLTLLNGGIYPELHRPEPVQSALLDPDIGPQLSASLNAELMASALAPTFAEGYDPSADVAEMWKGVSRGDGHLNAHRLIRYITDRATHRDRWVDAMETSNLPKTFIWGLRDPISGAHMAERIAERMPDAPLHALGDVGHWPPLEAPQRVAALILAAGGSS